MERKEEELLRKGQEALRMGEELLRKAEELSKTRSTKWGTGRPEGNEGDGCQL